MVWQLPHAQLVQTYHCSLLTVTAMAWQSTYVHTYSDVNATALRTGNYTQNHSGDKTWITKTGPCPWLSQTLPKLCVNSSSCPLQTRDAAFCRAELWKGSPFGQDAAPKSVFNFKSLQITVKFTIFPHQTCCLGQARELNCWERESGTDHPLDKASIRSMH